MRDRESSASVRAGETGCQLRSVMTAMVAKAANLDRPRHCMMPWEIAQGSVDSPLR